MRQLPTRSKRISTPPAPTSTHDARAELAAIQRTLETALSRRRYLLDLEPSLGHDLTLVPVIVDSRIVGLSEATLPDPDGERHIVFEAYLDFETDGDNMVILEQDGKGGWLPRP